MKYSMAKLIDSSVWIGLYVDDDAHHAKAVRLFKELSGTVYVPHLVCSEVATVVTYKHSKQQANRFVAFLDDNPNIELIDSDPAADRAFFQTITSKISFPDATLLRLAKELDAELVTYDKQLAGLYRKQK